MSKANPLPELMRAFFYEWLVEQRNASVNTIRSYRDTWRLFLRFVADRTKMKVAMISLTDLTAAQVAAFLRHAEHERGGTIGTRNCRLTAIRSFFNFVATRDPASIAQCVEILHTPIKRIWIHRKWQRSLPIQTNRPSKACAIMRCSRSSTTAGREYKKHSICALRRSGSIARTASDLRLRAEKSVSARFGRKP